MSASHLPLMSLLQLHFQITGLTEGESQAEELSR